MRSDRLLTVVAVASGAVFAVLFAVVVAALLGGAGGLPQVPPYQPGTVAPSP